MSHEHQAPHVDYPHLPQHAVAEPVASKKGWATALCNRWPRWMPIIGMGLIFLWADFAVAPLMDAFSQSDLGAIWVYVCLGIIPAQLGCLAVWLCWSVHPFVQRLSCYWLATAVGAFALLAGIAFGEGQDEFDELMRFVSLSLPLLTLVIQAPLWLVRQVFGWRLLRHDQQFPAEPRLAIRDLMVTTLLAALSLAAARIAPKDPPDANYWITWGIIAASSCGVSVIALLPICAWFLRKWNIGLAILLTLVYAAIAIAVTWLVSFLIDQASFRQWWWEMVGLAIMIGSFAVTLALAALAARADGYRLEIGRSATPRVA
jgi:hypothetical protein